MYRSLAIRGPDLSWPIRGSKEGHCSIQQHSTKWSCNEGYRGHRKRCPAKGAERHPSWTTNPSLHGGKRFAFCIEGGSRKIPPTREKSEEKSDREGHFVILPLGPTQGIWQPIVISCYVYGMKTHLHDSPFSDQGDFLTSAKNTVPPVLVHGNGVVGTDRHILPFHHIETS